MPNFDSPLLLIPLLSGYLFLISFYFTSFINTSKSLYKYGEITKTEFGYAVSRDSIINAVNLDEFARKN